MFERGFSHIELVGDEPLLEHSSHCKGGEDDCPIEHIHGAVLPVESIRHHLRVMNGDPLALHGEFVLPRIFLPGAMHDRHLLSLLSIVATLALVKGVRRRQGYQVPREPGPIIPANLPALGVSDVVRASTLPLGAATMRDGAAGRSSLSKGSRAPE